MTRAPAGAGRPARGLVALAVAVAALVAPGACSKGRAQRSPEPPPVAAVAPPGDEAAVRRAVVAALRADEPGLADVAARPDTRLVRLDAPLLDRFALYRVESLAPPHPVVFHVAVGPGLAPVWRLNAAPDRFAQVVADDGVKVASGADAVALLRLQVETTRNPSRRHLLVERLDDLTFRPLPPDGDAAGREALRARLARVLAPPAAAPAEGGGYTVTAWLLDGQDLLALAADVSAAGALAVRTTPAETGLPLVYVR